MGKKREEGEKKKRRTSGASFVHFLCLRQIQERRKGPKEEREKEERSVKVTHMPIRGRDQKDGQKKKKKGGDEACVSHSALGEKGRSREKKERCE